MNTCGRSLVQINFVFFTLNILSIGTRVISGRWLGMKTLLNAYEKTLLFNSHWITKNNQRPDLRRILKNSRKTLAPQRAERHYSEMCVKQLPARLSLCYVKNDRMTGAQVRQNSRPPSLLPLPCFLFSDLVLPGITPILPKTANQPSARATTGLIRDPCCKTYLYVFGFTRNNAW